MGAPGGTSKGVFLAASQLPPPGPLRDRVILRLFGSPDPRQIDGLGGADTLTSKLVPPAACFKPYGSRRSSGRRRSMPRPGALEGSGRRPEDVDYTFGQVSFVERKAGRSSSEGL